MQWQECWNEVEKHSGIRIREQMKNYDQAIKPWAPPIQKKKTATIVGEDPQWTIKVLLSTIEDLKNAQTIMDLQKMLIIYNLNEFRLNDEPTEDDFLKIVDDFAKWSTRTQEHWVGNRKIIRQALSMVDRSCSLARLKFRQLKNKVA